MTLCKYTGPAVWVINRENLTSFGDWPRPVTGKRINHTENSGLLRSSTTLAHSAPLCPIQHHGGPFNAVMSHSARPWPSTTIDHSISPCFIYHHSTPFCATMAHRTPLCPIQREKYTYLPRIVGHSTAQPHPAQSCTLNAHTFHKLTHCTIRRHCTKSTTTQRH